MKDLKSKTFKSVVVVLALALTVGCSPTDDDTNTTTSQQQGQQNNGGSSSSNNGGSSGTDPINFSSGDIDLSTCTVLGSTSINSDTVWGNHCYKLTGSLSVNAKLTINPGTVLVFSSGDGIIVNSEGTLKAVGTAIAPIVFTGEEKTPGYWKGIWFDGSNNTNNELVHVLVEYGGGSNYYGNIEVSDSRLKVSDTTFQYSEKDGFYINGSSTIGQFERVTSTKNEESAGKIHAKILGNIDSASNFIGNTKNYLEVTGGIIEDDTTWNELTVPAFFSGTVTVSSEATLTIKPGAVFSFGSDNGMFIEGALKAVGLGEDIKSGIEGKSILFTGEEKTPGYWKGIWFDGSNNVKNELSYVTVEYGGGSNYYGNIEISNSRLKISDTILRHSEKDGFYINSDSIIDKFERVTSTLNEKSAGKISAKILGAIDSASTFTENSKNYLEVTGGTIDKDATWHALSTSAYFSNSVTISDGTSVTIEPGTVMEFGSNNGLVVYGVLKSIGTSTNQIIFTGAQETAGYWKGIWFDGSNNVDNEIAYNNISYGGGSNYYGNIEIGGNSRVNIHNNNITNSAKYGIWASSSSSVNDDIATSNTFSNNADGGFYQN